eukprot:1931577-Rhodomonas_salina.6
MFAFLAGAYTKAYWCLFPPSAKDNVVPELQDCLDHLVDRLGELQEKEKAVSTELHLLKNKRDRTKLRRLFIERRDLHRDIAVTENTVFTVEKQLHLLSRRGLDNMVVGALHNSVSVLNNMQQDIPTVDEVERLTTTLQDRMQEVSEINDCVSGALQRGLDEDFGNLEEELDAFLKEESVQEETMSKSEHASEKGRVENKMMQNIPLASNTKSKKYKTNKTSASVVKYDSRSHDDTLSLSQENYNEDSQLLNASLT